MNQEQETECSRETENQKRNKAWIENRKSKRSDCKKVRKSKSKGQDESFIERQAEDELEDMLVKAAFSAIL